MVTEHSSYGDAGSTISLTLSGTCVTGLQCQRAFELLAETTDQSLPSTITSYIAAIAACGLDQSCDHQQRMDDEQHDSACSGHIIAEAASSALISDTSLQLRREAKPKQVPGSSSESGSGDDGMTQHVSSTAVPNGVIQQPVQTQLVTAAVIFRSWQDSAGQQSGSAEWHDSAAWSDSVGDRHSDPSVQALADADPSLWTQSEVKPHSPQRPTIRSQHAVVIAPVCHMVQVCRGSSQDIALFEPQRHAPKIFQNGSKLQQAVDHSGADARSKMERVQTEITVGAFSRRCQGRAPSIIICTPGSASERGFLWQQTALAGVSGQKLSPKRCAAWSPGQALCITFASILARVLCEPWALFEPELRMTGRDEWSGPPAKRLDCALLWARCRPLASPLVRYFESCETTGICSYHIAAAIYKRDGIPMQAS